MLQGVQGTVMNKRKLRRNSRVQQEVEYNYLQEMLSPDLNGIKSRLSNQSLTGAQANPYE